MSRGYIFVDGSRLFASINDIWRANPEFRGRRLKLDALSAQFGQEVGQHLAEHVRTTYYFKKGDVRIQELLSVPDATQPGGRDHWQIEECGVGVATIPQEQLLKLDEPYRDVYPRGEKGLDMRIACDALSMIANGRVENMAFLVNDRDYVPLFQAIQRLGGNVYLIGLDKAQKPHEQLAGLADKYFTFEQHREHLFERQVTITSRAPQVEVVAQAETGK